MYQTPISNSATNEANKPHFRILGQLKCLFFTCNRPRPTGASEPCGNMGGTSHKTILLLPLSPIWESFLLPSLTDVRVISTYYNLQRAPSHKPSHWGMMNHPKLGPLGWKMWIFANFIVKQFCWLPTLASTSPCHCNAAEVGCGNTSCTWDFFCKNYTFLVVAQKLIMQQCNVSIFWAAFS